MRRNNQKSHDAPKILLCAWELEQFGSHGSHGNGSDNDYIMGIGMRVGIKVWELE